MGVKIVLSAGGTEGRKGGGREEGGRQWKNGGRYSVFMS